MSSNLPSPLLETIRRLPSLWFGCVLVWCFLCPGDLRAEDDSDLVLAANRTENKGIALWRAGDYEAGGRLIERAIESDPSNPQRLLNYGSLLMLRGQEQIDDGNAEVAAKTLEESERQLTKAIKLAEGLPDRESTAGLGFFLLGEIAFYARKDDERAAKFYRSAAMRLPGDPRIEEALARVEENLTAAAESGSEPETPPEVPLGAANSITLDGRTLRLASKEENEVVAVEEYVPPGETKNNWTMLFAYRQHRRFIEPEKYASLLSTQAAKQGGKVLSTVSGPGKSASVVFIVHAPAMHLSEINVWNLIDDDGTLISEQFARRIQGVMHQDESEELARANFSRWVRELQDRHPVELVQTSAVPVSAGDDEEE